MLSRFLLVAAAGLATLGGASPADAYIGPGAGFAFLSSFLVLALSFALALLSLLLWPFRLLLNRWRRRTTTGGAGVERVVIVGLDGLDPGLAERYMADGKLPNFARLQAQGTFVPLATSYPSISPAAWSWSIRCRAGPRTSWWRAMSTPRASSRTTWCWRVRGARTRGWSCTKTS